MPLPRPEWIDPSGDFPLSSGPAGGRLAAVNEPAQLTLATRSIRVVLVPASGGRVASLVHLRTGREWLWRPQPALHFPAVATGASFTDGPLTGIDECLPTVAGCTIGGRDFGDHGDAWTQAWSVLAASAHEVSLQVAVPGGGLQLTRTLRLSEDTVTLDYTLHNRGPAAEPWLWSFHPLFRFEPGDRFELPAGVTRLRVNGSLNLPGAVAGGPVAWPSPGPGIDLARLDFGAQAPGYLKGFAENVAIGRAAVHAASGRERLEIGFDPAATPHLGVWITHGGWRGVRHGAIEPCTAATDSLADMHPPARLAPGATARWWVTLRCVAD